jgi:hypothetical protein
MPSVITTTNWSSLTELQFNGLKYSKKILAAVAANAPVIGVHGRTLVQNPDPSACDISMKRPAVIKHNGQMLVVAGSIDSSGEIEVALLTSVSLKKARVGQ